MAFSVGRSRRATFIPSAEWATEQPECPLFESAIRVRNVARNGEPVLEANSWSFLGREWSLLGMACRDVGCLRSGGWSRSRDRRHARGGRGKALGQDGAPVDHERGPVVVPALDERVDALRDQPAGGHEPGPGTSRGAALAGRGSQPEPTRSVLPGNHLSVVMRSPGAIGALGCDRGGPAPRTLPGSLTVAGGGRTIETEFHRQATPDTATPARRQRLSVPRHGSRRGGFA
jgi:hypothetical protein